MSFASRLCLSGWKFSGTEAFLFVAIAVGYCDSARAIDSSELRASYGRGVHAFFAGDTESAEQLFSVTIESGSTDPRVYYFRAMVRLRTGRQNEAEHDMRTGAALEARNPGNMHAIGKALQRVQGPGRRTLEKFRRDARLDRVQQRRQQSHRRYEQLQQRGPVVLRQQSPILLENLLEPSLGSVPRTSSPAPTAGTPVTIPRHVPAPMPSDAPKSVESDDLFGDSNKPSEDVFGAGVPEAAPEKATDPNNLFGDPFESGSSTDTSEKEPEEKSKETESLDDLFGVATKNQTEKHQAEKSSPAAVVGGPEKLFFELGRMVGTLSNSQSRVRQIGSLPKSESRPSGVVGANFQLGPSNDADATPASPEKSSEKLTANTEDIFGADAVEEPQQKPLDLPATDHAADEEDDLFGDF